MNSQLCSLLNEEKGVLVSEVANRLKNSSADHYRHTELSRLLSNCNKLIQAFGVALKEEQEGFTESVRKISQDRIKEGFDLEEMQFALNTIEEMVWRQCIEKVDDEEEKLEDLHLIASLIGSAKDILARQYLEVSQEAAAAAAPIWRKEQDAQVLSWWRLAEKWANG